MNIAKKVLLTIFPYWDPMIPPMGIVSLKRYLEKYKYKVKTVDFIVEKTCLDFYYDYFAVLDEFIPDEKKGNFRNIGHDVFQNHLMAFQKTVDKSELENLLNLLIYNHYYVEVPNKCLAKLNNLTGIFYENLGRMVLDLISEFRPDVFGATVYKCTLPATLFAMRIVKEMYPNIITAIGGGTFNESHAPDSPSFDALLEESKSYIDKIFLGQGEELFLKFLENKLDVQKRVYSKEDNHGRIIPFEKLDIPDFKDLDLKRYPYLAATASSGCLYNCSFCVSKKISGGYRTKCSKQLINEMRKLYTLHGHQLFFMTDSLINPVIDKMSREFISSDLTLYYDAYFKVDKQSSNINNTLIWRKGGLYRVRLGAESGSQKILNKMFKKITPDDIRASLRGLAYAGIKTTTYWVIGHPDETEADFQQTLDLIEELKNDIFQAECNYFLYHFSNQASADIWAKYRKPLYPDWANDLLVFKHWTLDYYPQREIAFKRVNQFEAHCRKLGIPNPYSIKEHNEADKRWQKLHNNAVPPLSEFSFSKTINECKSIQLVSPVKNGQIRKADFSFNI